MSRFLIPPLVLLVPSAWVATINPWFIDDIASFCLGLFMLSGLGFLLPRVPAPVGRGAVLAWVIAGLVILRPSPPPVEAKLVVLGIDGASWDLIDGLHLPQLRGMQQRGSRATLQSMEPMLSPILWTTMATGRRPSEHGIVGFRTRSDHVAAPRFWDIASRDGWRVGIYKWLVTWPPDQGLGFMVPAWLAGSHATHPPDLGFVKELELSNRLHRKNVPTGRSRTAIVLDGIQHGLRWSTVMQGLAWTIEARLFRPDPQRRAEVLQPLRTWIDRDVFIWSLHQTQPELATFTTYAVDALAHTHWQSPNHTGAVARALHQADHILGEIVNNVGSETTVVVLSDHGFRDATPEDASKHHRPTTETLERLARQGLGAAEVARLGTQLVLTTPHEAPQAWLETLLRQSTGKPLYQWETTGPDTLALTLRDHTFSQELLRADTVASEPLAQFVEMTPPAPAEHDVAGVWLASGPGIPPENHPDPMQLLDVAPTLLALMGYPPAQDMPGQVRFVPSPHRIPTYGTRPTSQAAPPQVEGQLRALGYVE